MDRPSGVCQEATDERSELMTSHEFMVKAMEFDKRLVAAGFCKEWVMMLGMVLGRMIARMGVEEADAALSDFMSLMKVGQREGHIVKGNDNV